MVYFFGILSPQPQPQPHAPAVEAPRKTAFFGGQPLPPEAETRLEREALYLCGKALEPENFLSIADDLHRVR